MKIIDKIVKSITPPNTTNVLWYNPETNELKVFQDGWEIINNTSAENPTSVETMINVTHNELLAKRNAGELIPGQQYRIIDYVATTNARMSESANHPFDIIVTAKNVDALYEEAKAMAHEGDTYFKKCDLSAWKLKYSIDNDSFKFTWADTEKGKGVIYEMIDENNNRAGYDFKGIVFRRYKVTEVNFETKTHLIGTYVQYDAPGCTLDKTDFYLCYLFNYIKNGVSEDASVLFSSNVLNEKPHDNNFKHGNSLLNGVFHIKNYYFPYNCTAGMDSKDWTCSGDSNAWTCGDNCENWVCGEDCYSWTCGDGCYSWTCGDNCYSWTCGNSCASWTCGDSCSKWTCGNNCYDWTCGNECSHWNCGNSSASWICGNECRYWTCGDDCQYWTCGNQCCYWTCGNEGYYWQMANSGVGEINISTQFPQIVNASVPYHMGLNSQGTAVCKNLFD